MQINELRKTTSSFEKYDKNLDEVLEKISDIALNAKKMFNCSIISKKHEILKLILSNTRIEGKNLYFSINKPFDKLLFSKGCKTWYSVLSEYRAKHLEDFKKLAQQVELMDF